MGTRTAVSAYANNVAKVDLLSVYFVCVSKA